MVDAFAVNQSLKRVDMHFALEGSQSTVLIDRVLVPLSSHPTLETIELSRIGHMPLSDPFLSVLRGPRGPNLRCIILKDSIVTKKLWKQILDVVTIERMTLENCRFSKKATAYFIKSLQPQREATDATLPVCDQVALSLSHCCFEGSTTEKVLSQVWKKPCVALMDVSKSPSLLENASQDSHFIQLSSICVRCERCGLDDVAKFLPRWTKIRELTTKGSEGCEEYDTCNCTNNPNPDVLTCAFRRNGSLVHVAVDERPSCPGRHKAIFGEEQVRKINAYCERNKHSAEVLSVRPDEDEGLRTLPLFPPVFLSVQPAWKTAPNSLLIGLLAANDTTIGHMTGDGKRLASTANHEATSDDSHRPPKRRKNQRAAGSAGFDESLKRPQMIPIGRRNDTIGLLEVATRATVAATANHRSNAL